MTGQGHDQPDEPEGVPAAGEDEHTHEGTFATGQEETEHHPENPEESEDFAEGQEEHKHAHEGSFAEGEETPELHPERPGTKRDFAEGQEEEHPA
jgi:hypothetical protein